MTASTSRQAEPRQRLGRGLAALLGDSADQALGGDRSRAAKQVAIEFLRSNPRNPRQTFGESELEDLAASIREKGIIQPIVVRPMAGAVDTYEIVAGERRWRAAQKAGQHTVPVIALQLSDREALELSIVENVQRADLNALEEARGYALLAAEHGYNQADIARVLGKSRSHVANTLRLLGLPEHTRKLLALGEITAGHARALLALDKPDEVADEIVANKMTVRDVEKYNERAATSTTDAGKRPEPKPDPVTRDLENKLTLALGAEAVIKNSKRISEIRIRFKDLDQLEYICAKLMRD